MVRVIPPGPGEARAAIHVWARALPPGALAQLERIAAQPYVVEHIAAMPDVHVAHGVAVGTVFATERTLVPAALGGDLGCGMSALRFDFPAAALSVRDRQQLLLALGRRIPVGDAVHRGRGAQVPEALLEAPLSTGALTHARARLAPRHLGTLGGGNHFVELDRDAGGDLWLLVHSGSRGWGRRSPRTTSASQRRRAWASSPASTSPPPPEQRAWRIWSGRSASPAPTATPS